jgi:hypothetical protein
MCALVLVMPLTQGFTLHQKFLPTSLATKIQKKVLLYLYAALAQIHRIINQIPRSHFQKKENPN